MENNKYCHYLYWLIFVTLSLLSACASQSSTDGSANNSEPDASVSAADSSKPAGAESQQVSAETDIENVPDIVEPLRVVESCKKEPYIQHEIQARESIKKGWEATKAEKYGVGFRNTAEYKKWSATHNIVYKKVSTACEELSKCAKKNPKEQQVNCEQQAKRYSSWQKTAASFAKKIKLAETQQPPKLCSIAPSADDLSYCYEKVASNIDKVCKSELCQEVSQCWRGIAYLDGAIRQSEQSCHFVHQKLEDCRAFTESTGRREAEFKSCETLYGRLDIEVQPAL